MQGYVLEIFFYAAVPLIDEYHFEELIRRSIKECSRKNYFNPLPISQDFDTVSWLKFNHGGSMVNFLACIALYDVNNRELIHSAAGGRHR
jgi:hypothetical protein